MQTSKQKGDFLENIFYIFEKCLDESLDKKIYKNHIIKDSHGNNREIDIYIEYKVGYKTIKIAVECKNYKNGIAINKIDELNGKIRDTDIIGYFVTTSNFQKGAIQKAKDYGIKLLHFKKQELDPSSIRSTFFIKKEFKINSISILYSNNEIDKQFAEDALFKCKTCSKFFFNLLKFTIIPEISSKKEIATNKMFPNMNDPKHFKDAMGISSSNHFKSIFELESKDYFIHEGINLKVKNIVIDIQVWNQIVSYQKNIDPTTYTLFDFTDKKILGKISPTEFVLSDKKYIGALVDVQENKASKITIIDNKEVKTTDSFSIDINESKLKEIIDNLENNILQH